MEVKNKYSFFFMILFFAGSVVLMSVKDLRKHFKNKSSQSVDMKEVVRVLHGDLLPEYKFDAGKFAEQKGIPVREQGQILATEDKKWIKGVVREVVNNTVEDH